MVAGLDDGLEGLVGVELGLRDGPGIASRSSDRSETGFLVHAGSVIGTVLTETGLLGVFSLGAGSEAGFSLARAWSDAGFAGLGAGLRSGFGSGGATNDTGRSDGRSDAGRSASAFGVGLR